MKKLLAISLALIRKYKRENLGSGRTRNMVSIAAAEDVITIGFAQVGHESDWRAANTLDYQNTFTAENGYELLFVDADNDHTAQMEAVRNFIQQEVDYIVICPVQEAGWDVVLQEAQDAGIPVIIADRTVSADPSLYSCFIGTDSAAEGVQAGEWLAEQLDGAEANILVIEGSVGASAAIGRTEGFNQVAAEHPEWKILDSQSGDFTQAGGQQVMESYLKSYPDQFNVVVCQNDNEAYGAIDAMKAAGVTYGVGGDVILISFDATKQGLTLTLNGEINCNVECNPLQAQGVAELIAKLEAGECSVVMILEESVLKKREEEGSTLEWFIPDDGNVLIPSTVMTVAPEKSANNNIAACEAITDWLLSDEGQSYIVKGWMHSVITDYATEPYDGKPTQELMDTNIPVDWEKCYKERDSIRTLFQENVTVE